MAYKIEDIEGIGPAFAAKLASAGIDTTDDLLEHCADSKGRKQVSVKTGLGEGVLLKWANLADLMRIKGVGSEYSELLEAAGVDTVRELKMRNAENLTARMAEVNEARKLTRATPTLNSVASWIEQAKALPPRITH